MVGDIGPVPAHVYLNIFVSVSELTATETTVANPPYGMNWVI